MDESQTKEVLRAILEVVKQQMIFLDRQYGWILALSETLRTDDDLRKRLEQHSQFDQGEQPQLRHIRSTIENIDALIQRLKVQ